MAAHEIVFISYISGYSTRVLSDFVEEIEVATIANSVPTGEVIDEGNVENGSNFDHDEEIF